MGTSKRCVLMVDDDVTLTNLFKVFMRKNGYEVCIANSGPDGLRLVRERDPMLVILDVMMPKMDGWEVCARLREFSDIPIIMLTARGTERDIMTGVERGADDYIVKPFRVKELLARIEAVLERKSAKPD